MSTVQTWVVCEHSGRWAAALRVAFARSLRAEFAPRLYELRNLADLTTHVNDHRDALGLVEARQANLSEVLALLADFRSRRRTGFVALLDPSVYPSAPVVPTSSAAGKQLVVDALREAGAVDVVESPRHLDRLLALAERIATASSPQAGYSLEGQSVADWAWSRLPWQDR